jgi:transposase
VPARAQAQDRVEVHLRDVHCFGRPARLVLVKRRWRCRRSGCVRKTWTEKIEGVAPRQVLTVRAGMEVCRQVGQLCRPVASVADEYGVAWDTAWAAVVLHGRPLVDDPSRVRSVRALGVDEHSFLAATRTHRTIYATALVDLDRRRVIDLFEGKSSVRLRNWCAKRPKRWLSGVRVVALDLTDTYRSGLAPHLSHARHVADHLCGIPRNGSYGEAGIMWTVGSRHGSCLGGRISGDDGTRHNSAPVMEASGGWDGPGQEVHHGVRSTSGAGHRSVGAARHHVW